MGDYTFIITGTIIPTVTADSVFTLSIRDPCAEVNQVTLNWAAQTNPNIYFYTGLYEQITLVKPIVTPNDCPMTYSCVIGPNSPRTDLCQIN